MKRQIIKTKPVRPYAVARVIIALALAAIAAALVYIAFERRPHASIGQGAARTTVRQDFQIFARKSQSPDILT